MGGNGGIDYRKRFSENVPVFYMTVVGIIQALALSILIERTFTGAPDLGRHLLRIAPYAFCSLVVVTVVLYQYTWLAGIADWTSTISEATLAVALGFTEVAPMFFLNNPFAWWLLSGLFLGTTGLAYLIEYVKVSRAGVSSEGVRITKQVLRDDAILCCPGVVVCLAAAFTARSGCPAWVNYLFCLIFLIGPFELLRRGELGKNRLCSLRSNGPDQGAPPAPPPDRTGPSP